MVLPQVLDVIGHSVGFPHGVHAGLQIGDQNFTCGRSDAVQISGAVLDFCDPEMDPAQRRAVRTALDNADGGLDGIGEHKLCVVVPLELNDTLGLINHIARAGNLCHDIGSGVELTEVNGSILQSGELLGTKAAVHRLNGKLGVGDDLGGVCAVSPVR